MKHDSSSVEIGDYVELENGSWIKVTYIDEDFFCGVDQFGQDFTDESFEKINDLKLESEMEMIF